MKFKMLLGNRLENCGSSDEEAGAKSGAVSYNEEPDREDCFFKSLNYTNRTENERDVYYPYRFTPDVPEAMDLSCGFIHRNIDKGRQGDEINECTTKSSAREELRRIEKLESGKSNMEQEQEKEVPEAIYDRNCAQTTIQNLFEHFSTGMQSQMELLQEFQARFFANMERYVFRNPNNVPVSAELDPRANMYCVKCNKNINHEPQSEVNFAELTVVGAADHAPEENIVPVICSHKDDLNYTNNGNILPGPFLEDTSSQKKGRPDSRKACIRQSRKKTNIQQVERDHIVSRKDHHYNEKPNESGPVLLRKSKRILCKKSAEVLNAGINSNISNRKFSKKKYTCYICGDAQKTIKEMYNHKRNHYLFTCLVCKKKIRRIDAFQRHMKKSHPDFLNQAS